MRKHNVLPSGKSLQKNYGKSHFFYGTTHYFMRKHMLKSTQWGSKHGDRTVFHKNNRDIRGWQKTHMDIIY